VGAGPLPAGAVGPFSRAARRVIWPSRELGIDLIDTANSYGPEVSEELIAQALHPYEEDLTVATKAGLTRSGPGEWHADCRPESLKRECEGSLKRLKVDRIDLFQLHTVDRKVPYEESVGALKELQDEGKIRYIGVSNERHDATPGQVALAWLLQRSEVMLPIPGTGSPEHLEENAGAASLRLDDDEFSRLAEAA
jgi:aryl-alcohol dehydrogenase-like predicted oxidoreductase